MREEIKLNPSNLNFVLTIYEFRIFKFRIILRFKLSFFGTSKIGLINWFGAGVISFMADLFKSSKISIFIASVRVFENDEGGNVLICGIVWNCIFNPWVIIFKITLFWVTFLQACAQSLSLPAPGKSFWGWWLALLVSWRFSSVSALLTLVTLVVVLVRVWVPAMGCTFAEKSINYKSWHISDLVWMLKKQLIYLNISL